MKPELLAPVGNMECLFAAINAGCDAVYLSGINFGARSFAGNFTLDELTKAINTCHLYGVKVYVTVNTLIYDDEVEKFMQYIDFLHKNNVDALIMQDIGMIDLVRKTHPTLDIHASTQAHIHNLEGVKLMQKLGLKRVVLARETPIELVEEIKKNTKIELEIFIHGALCMSYSGECLMSALIGERSGNRGTCAQCCRQPYDLEIDEKIVNKEKYLLSCKDLNTIDNIGKLIDIGVDSLKIEGRMKRPEYVYLITSLYRKAIDNYIKYGKTNITSQDIKEMKKIFNREFTKGFLFNAKNDEYTNTFRPNHMGIEIGIVLDYKKGVITLKLTDGLNVNDGIRIIGNPDIGLTVITIYKGDKKVKNAFKNDIVTIKVSDVVKNGSLVLKTTDYEQLKKLNEKIKINKKIKIDAKCILKLDKPIEFSVTDGKNIVNIKSDYIVTKAKTSKTTKDVILEKLKRINDTIYEYETLEIENDDDIFVPINVLNELRRKVMHTLDEKRMYKKDYTLGKYEICVDNFKKVKEKSVLIDTYDKYLSVKDKYDIIYVDNLELFNKLNDKKCVLKLSRVCEHLDNYDIPVLACELGSVYKYKNKDTDFSLNVTNSYSVAFLHSMGVKKVTLSYELDYKQIENLIREYEKRYKAHPNLEVIISGYEEAMVSKYNLLEKYNCKNGYLIDRFKNKYKIKIKDNLMYIYNYKKRNLKDNFYDIGVNSVRDI